MSDTVLGSKTDVNQMKKPIVWSPGTEVEPLCPGSTSFLAASDHTV